jgi:hypothetical protein
VISPIWITRLLLVEFGQLLMDLRLRGLLGCRARTVQQRKCQQQAHWLRQLPVAGLLDAGLRVGCGAA